MKSFNNNGAKKIGMNNYLFVVVGLLLFITSCDLFSTEEDTTIRFYKENDLSLTQYIKSNPDSFSILYEILDSTGLDHLFKTYGDYTFLAPTDGAFIKYFEEKGKGSANDFTKDELTQLVKYHVFNNRILASGFNMGIIGSKTLSFDYMVSTPTVDGSDIILNKRAKIVYRNQVLPNGILHVIDHVLEKPEKTIYDWLKENQSEYSIFLEAVEKTGVKDLLSDNSTEEFYSCFVTPDIKYNESNINSFNELVKFISPNNTNLNDPENLFRSYILGHFTKNVVSTSDATEDQLLMPSISGATIKYGLLPNTGKVLLNYKTKDFPEGLGIDGLKSNNLVSNGIIHVMDTMFQLVKAFEREKLLFIYLDVPGIPYDSLYDYGVALWEEQGIAAKSSGGELGIWSQFWPRPGGPNHLPFERTNGWLTLNAPYSAPIRSDHHRNMEWNTPFKELYGQGMPLYFTFEYCDDLLDVTRKFPYIIPGKYRLLHYTKAGTSRPTIRHYFDGKPVGGIINLQQATKLDFQDIDLGVVEIEEGSTEHFLRIQMVTPGKGFYVAIKFEPVD